MCFVYDEDESKNQAIRLSFAQEVRLQFSRSAKTGRDLINIKIYSPTAELIAFVPYFKMSIFYFSFLFLNSFILSFCKQIDIRKLFVFISFSLIQISLDLRLSCYD